MFGIGKSAWLSIWLAFATSLWVGVRSEAHAQVSDAAAGEFRRACAGEISRFQQSGIALGGVADNTDQRFGQILSLSGATTEGLRRVDSEVTARVQRYVADTPAAREYSVAAGELDHCAVRVGLRHVSGGGSPGTAVAWPPSAAELQDLQRNCATELAERLILTQGPEWALTHYRRIVSDEASGRRRSATELRQQGLAEEEHFRARGRTGEGMDNLFRCIVRVGLRYAAGADAAPQAQRVPAPAAPPRAPSAPDGPAAAARAALSLGRTDLPGSLRELNRLAAEGNSWAQAILGMIYSTGRGVPRDPARALLFMRQAAAQNLPEAVRRLPAFEQEAQREANAGGMAVASPAPTPSSRETLVHNPALEATHCVRIVAYGTPGSRGFTQSIANECGRVVEVSWCSTGGECERSSGNSWTLAASGPGSGYPVGSGEIRYGACLGRNSGGFQQGSQGQRITCTGDAGARPR